MFFFSQERDFLPKKQQKTLFRLKEEEDEDEDEKKKQKKKNVSSSEKKWHRLHLTSTSWQKKPSPPKSEKR